MPYVASMRKCDSFAVFFFIKLCSIIEDRTISMLIDEYYCYVELKGRTVYVAYYQLSF